MNDIVFAGRHALTHNVSRHVHTYWELIYCTSGSGRIDFADTAVSYHADEVIAIPPMLPHTNSSAEGFTNYFINLSDSMLSGNRPYKISADHSGFLLGAFSAAFYYYCEDAAENNALLNAYGQLIASFILRGHPDDRKHETTRLIESDIIRNFPSPDYDVNTVIDRLPFSPDYVVKLFKRDTGTTPHRFLTDKRLQVAADSIAGSHADSISEIAMLCGFREPLYFSRLFKKKYGVSPSFYLDKVAGRKHLTDSDEAKIYLT